MPQGMFRRVSRLSWGMGNGSGVPLEVLPSGAEVHFGTLCAYPAGRRGADMSKAMHIALDKCEARYLARAGLRFIPRASARG